MLTVCRGYTIAVVHRRCHHDTVKACCLLWYTAVIQPSGRLSLGNYIGAIRNWVAQQQQADNIFCVVDLHALTVYQEPEILRAKIRETVGLLLACGIDPAQSLLFVQSHVPAHAELAWANPATTSLLPVGT